ncbi:MAG: DUF2793 domain-containing protein [Alphaproteobacteria bacterium]|nr:DUF2793 domain-containing protein [Alphaproteobacteria bacterium]
MPNTTNRVKLPYILQSQSQKEVTHNASLDLIDALLQAAMVSVGVNTPPGSPVAGDCYVVGTSPTGAWAGQAKAVAIFTTAWNFIVPWEGLTVWANDANILNTYDGTNWIATVNLASFQNLTMLGVNTSADATNKLSVASAAILFNHIGGDMQVKINKNAAGNKASFLFQNGFSGRAEFGLLGDDNFTLKVSADGSTFFDALKMLAANGRVALKANATGLSAAGSTQGTATAITKQTNEFTTVGASQGGILPSPEQGEFIFVQNSGANALNVYPASGHSINALSANAAFSLAVGKNAMFWAATASKWYANLSA